MIGTALAIYSMISGLADNFKAKQAAEQAKIALDARKHELDLEYKTDANMDFLNTPMAKSAISLLSQKYIENARNLAQHNVITGASDEKAVAGSEALQKPYVNTISQLAGYGQQRQDALMAQDRSNMNALFGMEYNADMQKSQNLMDAGGNAFNAAGGILMANSLGAFGGADSWVKKYLGNWGGGIAKAGTSG